MDLEALRIQCERTWRFYRPTGGALELQALKLPGRFQESVSAVVTDVDALVRLLAEVDQREPVATYIIASLLADGVETRHELGRWRTMGKKGDATTDADCGLRMVFYVDGDPSRPRDTSATDAEREHALALVSSVYALLVELGIPEAAIGRGSSGNGAAVMVALEGLPNTPAATDLIRDLLHALALLLDIPGKAKIDRSTFDPKRLSPAWGTMKRKGAKGIVERPHRLTSFHCADIVERIDADALALLRDRLVDRMSPEQLTQWRSDTKRKDPAPTRAASQAAPTDVFKRANECPIREVLPWLGLGDEEQPICPGCGEADGSSVAIVENGLKCMHERCASKGYRNGFRTVVDLVAESRSVSPIEAAKALAERFGFEIEKPKAKTNPTRKKAERDLIEPAAVTDHDDDLPTITIDTHLHRVVNEACAALANAEDVYQRDGDLVRAVRAVETDQRRGVVEGTPQIRPLAFATLREVLTREARFERFSKKKDGTFEACPSMPTEAIVSAVQARATWPGIRPLSGVVETPCMRADGSILASPGYDARTGLLYEPSCDVAAVSDRPTQMDAMQALRKLCEVFADFPFASEAARYVPIAAILTLVGRPAIEGPTPLFAIDAPTRGSGKTMIGDVVSFITNGRSAPRMTYPPDEAELEKALASYALFGGRFILLDNISGTLGAAPLDKVLTSDHVAMRILGKTEVREFPWRAVICATGNNLVLGADTASRTLVCRIEPSMEKPEERTDFAHADLLGYVREQRGELVHAALTVLRAYVVAGSKCPSRNIGVGGRFISWAQLVSGAILFAGGEDVLLSSAASAGTPDVEADALRGVLAEFPRLGRDGVTARAIVETLWPAERAKSQARGECTPDMLDGLRDALEALVHARNGRLPDARTIGAALRRHRGRVIAGRRLVSHQGASGYQVWAVELPKSDSSESGDSVPIRTRESKTDLNGRMGSQTSHSTHPSHPRVAS